MNYGGISIYTSFYFNRKPLTTDLGENFPKFLTALREAQRAYAAPALRRKTGVCWGAARRGDARCCPDTRLLELLSPVIKTGMLRSRFGVRPLGLALTALAEGSGRCCERNRAR